MSLSEKSARAPLPGPEFARSEAAHLPGEFFALLQQVGSPDLPGFSAQSPAENVLQTYMTQILLPVELPAIAEACGHALRGELRELIAQDLELKEQIDLTPFAAPSRQMGLLQLARLRPLRDDRVVQRYLTAVKTGKANGWHSIVYGLTLALYSLPLRQGLLHYARETFFSLAKNAQPTNGAPTLDALMERLPAAVESALARC